MTSLINNKISGLRAQTHQWAIITVPPSERGGGVGGGGPPVTRQPWTILPACPSALSGRGCEGTSSQALAPLQTSISPPVQREGVLAFQPPPVDSRPLGECADGETGAQGSPAPSFPPGASQLRHCPRSLTWPLFTPTPPPRRATEPQAEGGSSHAAPDWLGPDSAHRTTPPLLRVRPPPPRPGL